MNVHTFKDLSKRDSLAHEVYDEGDEDAPVLRMKGNVEGEEDGTEKFNDIGEVMEPFNLKEERENGYYDEGGNYVSREDRQEVDAWVAELDEATMEQSIGETVKALQKKREREEKEEEIENKRVKRSLIELKKDIVSYLQPSETVTTALKRLATGGALKTNNWKNKDKSNVIKAVGGQKKVRTPSVVDKLIELVDACISDYGMFHIYSMTLDALEASLSMWEYKIPVEGKSLADIKEVFGPFTANQLAQWKSQGFFTGNTAVYLRRHIVQKKAVSMFDDDDDSEVAVVSKEAINDWILSDSIDFGEYVPEDKPSAQQDQIPVDDESESDDSDEDHDRKANDKDNDSDDDDQ